MIYWIAHYQDGTSLNQSEGASYGDINRPNLQAFDLWRAGQLLIRIDLRDDTDNEIGPRRLIWRIRHKQTATGQHEAIHMVGWQRQVNGRNIQAIGYVFEDGPILLGGQFVEQDFMGAIVPLTFESDLLS